ncbi:MAG TPA: hypothetical protein DCL54_06235 [Alphaproteobacteria bacterium]|nr:hypothetical protein [Alphaproteobacteria bacterium]HAJ46161.1 hypothetical protein [Alphaproteobacteria bacterium]
MRVPNGRVAFHLAVLAAAVSILPATAQSQSGVMTVKLEYQATTSIQVQDFDGTWERRTEINQSTTMTCPLMNEGVEPRSYLDGASQQQKDADAAIGEATAADQKTMQEDGTLAQMQGMDKLMKDCKARGGSDEACAMQVMQAMQSDPTFLERSGRVGEKTREAQKRVGNTDGRFEIWYSENCTGSMSANNRTTLNKGGVSKEVEAVAGRQPLSNVDANVVVETDLSKTSTRVWIAVPEATGFPRTGAANTKTEERLTALPVANVIAGPTPGGIKSGTLRKQVPGGEYRVEWTFQRK